MQTKLRTLSVTYYQDSSVWLNALRHLPDPIWLDSGRPASSYGRFDIISAAPQRLIETFETFTYITDLNGQVLESNEDPFSIIKQSVISTSANTACDTPFIGGAIGYFSYDLGRRLEKLPTLAKADIDLANMRIGIYPWAIVQDHEHSKAWLIINESLNAHLGGDYNFQEIELLTKRINIQLPQSTSTDPFRISNFKNDLGVNDYNAALTKIKEYILAGDCYQVNFAQRFSAEFNGDPLTAYQVLRTALPSPFSGFMQWDNKAVLCLSPERFIQARNKKIETKPIKGTIKRGETPDEDLANAHWLKTSAKNRAENVMIVDLLRNDLSKHCRYVAAPQLCELQTFANVHHLVSTITAELKDNENIIDVLRDSFPGGSITGAPKIRAMEIIEELEPTRRSIYCGSLGYISTDGQMDTNIAIRTLICSDKKIYCWGGGGIVADSTIEQEYFESITKVAVLMKTLEEHFNN